jgi:Di-haem oxidoreductase, putative peroxidase
MAQAKSSRRVGNVPDHQAFDPNGNPLRGSTYLHDGRARSIAEAILWHAGEVPLSHDAFAAIPAASSAALLAYVADPVPIRQCALSSKEPCPGLMVTRCGRARRSLRRRGRMTDRLRRDRSQILVTGLRKRLRPASRVAFRG